MTYSSSALARQTIPASQPIAGITYRQATTRDELEQAFGLVWKNYVDVGLHEEDDSGMRLTKYHLLPGTKVFIAVKNVEKRSAGKTHWEERVIGTLTVVQDSCLGLPAEEVCKNNITSLRHEGERLAEIIALASDQEGTDNRVVIKLFRLAYEYCLRNGTTQIIASLTKHHVGFYRRFVGFSPLGGMTSYRMANGLAVQVHTLDVKESACLVEKRAKALYCDRNWRRFWENTSEQVLMDACRMSPWDQEKIYYFASQHPDILKEIDVMTYTAITLEYERFGYEFSVTPGCNTA